MKKLSLYLSILLFSVTTFADPDRNGRGSNRGEQHGGRGGHQNRGPSHWNNTQRPNRGWNQHQPRIPNHGWNRPAPTPAPRYVPPRQVYRYPNRIFTPIYRAPVGRPQPGYIWHNGRWCQPPQIRYAYNTIAWAALAGVLVYYSYQVPAPATWACVVSMNGDVVAVGHGHNVTEAQQIALLNCDQGGYNCAYNYHAMDCAPR